MLCEAAQQADELLTAIGALSFIHIRVIEGIDHP
jgi:hypothetical protein